MADEILVGVDRSETSISALRWAVDEAARRRTTVRAVSVHMAQGHMIVRDDSRRGIATVTTQSVHTELAEALATIVGSLDITVPVDQVVLVGRAEEVLVDMSREAALLVLGSHGDSRVLTSLTLGAVTAHCIRHAACPVVVIPRCGQRPG
ncbi:universal stress protein [Kibdelosporangium aridum]|uniref:universal stress protein n=1 Tax=Kibdelosporangium aridum TaxID=2030 RepID=UPI00068AC6A4|nr:universal stress protein [Kibdelosporangium aridum]